MKTRECRPLGACDVGKDRKLMRSSKVCHIHGINMAVKQDASMSMGFGGWEGGICICILILIIMIIVIVTVYVFVLLVVKQHANRSKGRWYLSDCYECRSR